VYAADPEIFDDYEVGEFVFHENHNHWHLEQLRYGQLMKRVRLKV
jgi:hypothetical protein